MLATSLQSIVYVVQEDLSIIIVPQIKKTLILGLDKMDLRRYNIPEIKERRP
jgi:hypothetical protein